MPQIKPHSDRSSGHTAIVYFTHGEPETYDPSGWINQFREFDEQDIKFVPFLARPFFIQALRKQYLVAGKSNHRMEHFRMMNQLETGFYSSGDSTKRFYMAFLDDRPGVQEAVIQAINDGAKNIIISNVFLTVSSHTVCGYELINELHVKENYGVNILFTEPLWDSELLQKSFVEKLNRARGQTEKNRIAVALIGYGQPDEWDKLFPTQTEQEILFRQSIIKRFEEDGYPAGNLGMAWMEFKQPDIFSLLESFNYRNIEKVFYYSAAISADALISRVIVPETVNEFNFPEHVKAVNLGAWDAHPLVIQAIKEKIDKCLADVSTEEQISELIN